MKKSQKLFNHAQLAIPGGVNSPVRAFKSVGGTPLFFQRGKGPLVWDADGNSYIDYVGSWGPLICGHAHPDVVRAVQQAAERGLSFGAPTEVEIEMADLLRQLVPSLEQVRLVSSGTEATMSAIRLARGFTGRSKIIKFEGCYHGHADALLVKAGSGALTFGQPSSAGVPPEVAAHTLVLDYYSETALEETFAREGGEIAAVIVEPVAGNMNLVRATPEFLRTMRELTARHGALLVFELAAPGDAVAGRQLDLGGDRGFRLFDEAHQIAPSDVALHYRKARCVFAFHRHRAVGALERGHLVEADFAAVRQRQTNRLQGIGRFAQALRPTQLQRNTPPLLLDGADDFAFELRSQQHADVVGTETETAGGVAVDFRLQVLHALVLLGVGIG